MSDQLQQIQSRYEKVCARIGELYLELKAREQEMTAMVKQRDDLIMAHRKLTEAAAQGTDNGSQSSQDQAS